MMIVGSVCATSTQSTVTAEKHIVFSQEGAYNINMDICSFDCVLITCSYFPNKMGREEKSSLKAMANGLRLCEWNKSFQREESSS